jgi:hypothetical protein
MSSEQRTARERLIDRLEQEASTRRSNATQWREAADVTRSRASEIQLRRDADAMAADAELFAQAAAALRAAPAPEPEHVCGGCGYKWNWPVPSPIELCGDCWRKTLQILRGAAPAPEGETPKRECSLCGFSLALCLEAKLHGEACCPHCFHPPASPGPTPE